MKASIERAEWDFRQCCDEELSLCWLYEFEREKWLQSSQSPETLAYVKQLEAGLGELPEKTIWAMTGFPNKSWLSLDKKSQRAPALRALHAGVRLESYQRHVSLGEGEEVWFDWSEAQKEPNVSTVVLKLDWKKSDTRLKREFETLLNQLRPTKALDNNIGRKGNDRDNLNYLGAWRLLRHFNDAERVIEHTARVTEAFYQDARSLYRAAKKFEKLLASAQKPISGSCP